MLALPRKSIVIISLLLLAVSFSAASGKSSSSISSTTFGEKKLTAPERAVGDYYGVSVATDGIWAVVGASGTDLAESGQGAAYIYIRSGNTWMFYQMISASDGMIDDSFGEAVAISGDTILVGAPGSLGMYNSGPGSAYIFRFNGSDWMEETKFLHSWIERERFGCSVAIDGDTALVGSCDDTGNYPYQGSAYVFTFDGSYWNIQQELYATDGAEGDHFGISVALDGDMALISSADHEVDGKPDQGAAYVFTRAETSWTEDTQLIANDGVQLDRFGTSVDLDNGTALIGSLSASEGGDIHQGSAYVFVRSETWQQQAKLTASDGLAGDYFGISVALAGDTALVGAIFDDVGDINDQGSSYIFHRSGASWAEAGHLIASDGDTSDGFGCAVAVGLHSFWVGAKTADGGTIYGYGAAYVYTPAIIQSILPLVLRGLP